MNGLFDSPWHILILALVVIILFGSAKLPTFARSLGRSARILKTEVQGLHEDEPGASAQASAVQPAQAQIQAPPAQPTDAQAQIQALQKQLTDLQKNVAANGSVPADAQQAK